MGTVLFYLIWIPATCLHRHKLRKDELYFTGFLLPAYAGTGPAGMTGREKEGRPQFLFITFGDKVLHFFDILREDFDTIWLNSA